MIVLVIEITQKTSKLHICLMSGLVYTACLHSSHGDNLSFPRKNGFFPAVQTKSRFRKFIRINSNL